MRLRNQPAIRIVPPYYDHTIYIEALVQSIETHISKFSSPPEAIVVSYHGLPKRYITAGDLYYRQCTKTTELLVERLRLKKTQILMAFQSRFGKEEWLQPYTCDVVRELASGGVSNISVIAPGFATDCVETLGEIYGEIQEAYLDAGGKAFSYILCLNDHERHITLLINIIEDELSGWAKDAEPTVRICQNKKDK
jgi:ferrochelatase